MTLSLDYIAQNSLPIKSYLDFTSLIYSNINGQTYTQINLAGNNLYDFISEGVENHPQRGQEGVTFGGTRKLSPKTSQIINNESSYSIIIVSKNSNDNILKISKNNPSLPRLLELGYENKELYQKYSRLNVKDLPSLSGEFDSIQVSLISHDIISGVLKTSLNLSDFKKTSKIDAGHLLSNFSSFTLGENFDGELLNFLIFCPQIPENHLLELGKRVSNYSPQTIKVFDKLLLTTENNLEQKLYEQVKTQKKFKLPIKIKNLCSESNIGFESSLVVVLNYFWDNLEDSNWDNLNDYFWDNLS